MMFIARMARHDANWWAERVKELAQSGDAAGIARRHSVRERTLIWWRSELERRARTAGPTRLLPVVVTRPATVERDIELVVEAGPARITMRGAITAEHLAALVAAAARAC
ncbi:hypothetical protein [Pendulispora albinea]|uniref:Transposase n=1 Tax=Pendulispora albinea TaxID=2741071 RepID=A0ABZ2LPM8_9BACT